MRDEFFYGPAPRRHSARWLLLMLSGLLVVWLFAAPAAMADDPIGNAIGAAASTAQSSTDAVESTTSAATDAAESTTSATAVARTIVGCRFDVSLVSRNEARQQPLRPNVTGVRAFALALLPPLEDDDRLVAAPDQTARPTAQPMSQRASREGWWSHDPLPARG